MFMQSAAMALAFGSNFQYGKRKISSMSNEDFNKMSALDMNIDLANTVNAMIPNVEQSFKQMEKMNITILDSMARYFAQAIEFGFDVLTGKRGVTGTESHFDVSHIGENLGSLLPSFTPEQIIGENAQIVQASSQVTPTGSRNFSFLKTIPLGELQTGLIRRKAKGDKDIDLQLAIFKEIQRKIALGLDTKKKPVTALRAIEKSGVTGITKIISTNIANMKIYLKNLRIIIKKPRGKLSPQFKNNMKIFLRTAKTHNQLMQENRKYSFVVDTSKSIQKFQLIFKQSR